MGMADWAVPPVIVAAYEGRSLAVLNQILAGRSSAHPVTHYLSLWHAFAVATLVAGGLHFALMVHIGMLEEKSRRRDRMLMAFSASFLAFATLTGPRQDYVAYVEVWNAILQGQDPWWVHPVWGYPLNAYGPLFNPIAIFVGWNVLIPKLLVTYAYLAFVVWIVKLWANRPRSATISRVGLIALVANPYAWVEVAYFGHLDVVIAITCVGALHARRLGKDTLAGVSLALGILLKYLPVVLLPFLVVDTRRIRLRTALATVLTFAVGMGLSYLAWGPSMFRPLRFAMTRGSSLLSIFRFLRGTASPLRWITENPNVDYLALPCLALTGLGIFAWCVRNRVSPAIGMILGTLTTLLFYRVGFPQYPMTLFLLVLYALVEGELRVEGDRFLRVVLIGYFGALGLFDMMYALIGGVIHPGDPHDWLDEVVGLPAFALGGLLFWALISSINRKSDSPPDKIDRLSERQSSSG